MKLSEELIARGFIHQYTTTTLSEIIDGPKRVIYHGVDPSADSIHAGNFVQFMLLRHLIEYGHKVILLIGGGTGMIGDPKPDVERPLTPLEVVAERVEKLKLQAKNLFGGVEIDFVNNYDWLGSLNLVTFLRDIGKHFTVNELIKKDAIATRLKSDNGISYTEFAYPLLQAYDYLNLHRTHGCNVQTGGSDQWGNMVAGVDLIRKKEQQTVFAFTVPLIVDKATGKKFGKSEGNAVWLDSTKTSPYAFYQFWLNTSDESVIDYLKLFSLLSLEEIAGIEKDFLSNLQSRSAQRRLAKEVTTLVHGIEIATGVEKVSDCLFGEAKFTDLSVAEIEIVKQNAPLTKVPEGTNIIDILIMSGLASSKREARTFIESGAVSINGEKMESLDLPVSEKNQEGVFLLKRGKKKLSVIEVV
ncbi:tyrosine--tRNA ligase [Candidatus Kaiserbacteria bacterium RIFOXYD1_FULL_42_15]|uniref:Tyrosine--tRNA ligase n=1 Tax=Candidatus Kaiserbacteria bacterium RIFOXYD1_FULL_42_15 TaxID=1798532 RepID=A0A1F6FU18_9BACT|nr:MAG: tyrosine--tRNA ligase [Candidatus Kaiserbacteria bacterium RIFOXYD1_FULL_42_15]